VKKKGEFKCFTSESSMFQRGYPNGALTQQKSMIITIKECTQNFLGQTNCLKK
jgi:hypothetical protein